MVLVHRVHLADDHRILVDDLLQDVARHDGGLIPRAQHEAHLGHGPRLRASAPVELILLRGMPLLEPHVAREVGEEEGVEALGKDSAEFAPRVGVLRNV